MSGEAGVGVVFIFVLTVAVESALTLILGWHCYLVSTCQVRRGTGGIHGVFSGEILLII